MGKEGFLAAVDAEVHTVYGRVQRAIDRLDGEPWPKVYRVLTGELGVPGDRAAELTILYDRGELSPKDPADIGALD